MWYPFSDFDRTMTSFADIFSRLDRAPKTQGASFEASTVLFETPEGYEFRIDIPGANQDDLRLDVHDQTLTLSARRVVKAREGWSTHRSERGSFEWKRSFNFPEKIDGERVSANITHGVLTVRLAKAPQHQPKKVAITVG